MTRKLRILAYCAALLCFLAAPVIGFGQGISKPTDAQKQEVAEAMKRGDGYQKRYDECKKKEQEARDKGDAAGADSWSKTADLWKQALQANRELIILLVDQYYKIQAPPNTTITYDPNSTDYAYVPNTSTKAAKTLIVCPLAFSDGPGLVASTKYHEMEHCWQVHWCWSSHDGYWGDCTFWGHLAEWDSYVKEEQAYDDGITSDMPKSEKDLIKKRIRDHQRAMFRNWHPEWNIPLWHRRAGDHLSLPLVIDNGSTTPRQFQVSIGDRLGWNITPNFPVPFLLQPEEKWVASILVDIPTTAPAGTANQITLLVDSQGTTATDVSFVVVQPSVEVIPIEIVALELRGASIPLHFMVTNTADRAITATVQFSNPLGWPQTGGSSGLFLDLAAGASLITTVTVPLNAPPWAANTVYCHAFVQGDPADGDREWIPLLAKELDVGPLAIEHPFGTLAAGSQTTPTVWVMNTGHIDSFFDVFFEVRLPNNTVLTSASRHVSSLAPRASQAVTFGTLPFDQPGTFTARAYTVLPGDADTSNNVISQVFTVVDLTSPTVPGRPIPDKAPFTSRTLVVYAWSPSSDPESGIRGYRCQVGTTPGGHNVFDGLTSFTAKSVTGTNGRTLYARARAINRANLISAWSGVSSPTLIDISPPTPSGIPQGGPRFTSQTVITFRWTAATDGTSGSGVASYAVQVGTAPGAGNVFNGNVGNVLMKTVTGLNGQTLYARVRARDRAGNVGQWTASSTGVSIDLVRPRLMSVRVRSRDTLDIGFSEQVRNADRPANYSCTLGLRILAAQKLTGLQYRLTTTKQTPGALYTLTVGNGVTDLAGNVIDPAFRSRSFSGGGPTETRSWGLYR